VGPPCGRCGSGYAAWTGLLLATEAAIPALRTRGHQVLGGTVRLLGVLVAIDLAVVVTGLVLLAGADVDRSRVLLWFPALLLGPAVELDLGASRDGMSSAFTVSDVLIGLPQVLLAAAVFGVARLRTVHRFTAWSAEAVSADPRSGRVNGPQVRRWAGSALVFAPSHLPALLCAAGSVGGGPIATAAAVAAARPLGRGAIAVASTLEAAPGCCGSSVPPGSGVMRRPRTDTGAGSCGVHLDADVRPSQPRGSYRRPTARRPSMRTSGPR
jgi:hypothetical protein